jgi:hypothetical protein
MLAGRISLLHAWYASCFEGLYLLDDPSSIPETHFDHLQECVSR